MSEIHFRSEVWKENTLLWVFRWHKAHTWKTWFCISYTLSTLLKDLSCSILLLIRTHIFFLGNCWWVYKMVKLIWKIVWMFLRKLKIEVPSDPEIEIWLYVPTILKTETQPCLVWLSGLNADLRSKESLVWFPVRAHAWVVGKVPSRGRARDNHTLMFFSLSFSFPYPLKINTWNL